MSRRAAASVHPPSRRVKKYMVSLIRCSLAIIAAAVLVLTAAYAAAQGDYTPLTDDEVTGLRFNHYFTADKRHHAADFLWKFTKGEFVIQKGKGAVPAELCKKLSVPGDAVQISGKWRLAGESGQELVLSEIAVGGKVKMHSVRLPIYKTAPTVVRIGEPQYVFALGL